MKRRKFLASLGAAAAWPLVTYAQPAGPLPRLAILQPQSEGDGEAQAWVTAFRIELERFGWNDSSIQIHYRWYAGNLDLLRAHAAELIALQPNVIFCMSTPTVAALQSLTRTIPIIFVNANNPVGSGFVASLARPGGNITGFTAHEPALGGKWIELLLEIAPATKRVGLVYNPRTHTGQHFDTLETIAKTRRIDLTRLAFGDAPEIERSLAEFARMPRAGLIVMPDASTRVHSQLIVGLARDHGLPAVYTYRLFIAEGGLAYYGTDTSEQFRKAAAYVDRVLRGDSPADLPVQAPTKFELVINLKTAKALRLDVPFHLLQRADELIE